VFDTSQADLRMDDYVVLIAIKDGTGYRAERC
jgi:hypothetical protein